MTDWDRNAVRAFTPAVLCWLVSAAALLAMEWAQSQIVLVELASVLRWVVLAALLACVGSGASTAWRLWSRQRGLHGHLPERGQRTAAAARAVQPGS